MTDETNPDVEPDLGLPVREGPHFLAGVQDGWHAIDPAGIDLRCELHDWALCGAVVRRAEDERQPYDPAAFPVSLDPCPDCRWMVAAATGTFDAALAELRDPLAHAIAAKILAWHAEGEPENAHDGDMLQLLAAVSRHAPVELVTEECADGECDHSPCPVRPACRACSLQAGPSQEGQYRSECTIPAPCAVLLALAKSVEVTL